MNTTANDTWKLELQEVEYKQDQLLSTKTQALINPGFPFIVAPLDQFKEIKKTLMKNHRKDGFTCTAYDWCYFETHCDKLVIEPLVFKIGSDTSATYYTIPSSSFLFVDQDVGEEVCHLAIVTQRFKHMDFWILGGAFMNNFYVAYEITDDG